MRHSKAELYVHLVWATDGREPYLNPEMERSVHHCLQQEAVRLRCTVLALNGMPDHVHILTRIPPTLNVSSLAKQLKGVSSRFVSEQVNSIDYFKWQDGYGAFSISRSHVKRVVLYIKNQKKHHAEGTIWPEWEEVNESLNSP